MQLGNHSVKVGNASDNELAALMIPCCTAPVPMRLLLLDSPLELPCKGQLDTVQRGGEGKCAGAAKWNP